MTQDAASSPVSGARSGGADKLHRVAGFMAKHQIEGLPRNFELIYEALYGRNPPLARELAALGGNLTQVALDQIGLKHHLVSHCGLAEKKLHSQAIATLRRIEEKVSLGIMQKMAYSRGLETIQQSVRDDGARGVSDLMDELEFLEVATRDLLSTETEIEQVLRSAIEELNSNNRTVEAARSMTMRDRLTGLPNRLSLVNRLEQLFDTGVAGVSTALVLVDINDFRQINQQYGEDAGNRILKRLAAIFRKTIKKHDFVARSGGDEFAFLFSDVTAKDAYAIAERLHAAVEDNLVFAAEHKGIQGSLELSIGFAMSDDAEYAMQMIACAEAALAVAHGNSRQPIAGYKAEHHDKAQTAARPAA